MSMNDDILRVLFSEEELEAYIREQEAEEEDEEE